MIRTKKLEWTTTTLNVVTSNLLAEWSPTRYISWKVRIGHACGIQISRKHANFQKATKQLKNKNEKLVIC